MRPSPRASEPDRWQRWLPMAAAEAAMEALIDQACRDVLPRVYPLSCGVVAFTIARVFMERRLPPSAESASAGGDLAFFS